MRPKGVIDAQQVNIPAPAANFDPRMCPLKPDTPYQIGAGRFVAYFWGERSEKSSWVTRQLPVLKLTQVDEENILRRSRELRLRN